MSVGGRDRKARQVLERRNRVDAAAQARKVLARADGVLAPAGTPKDIITKLNAAFAKAPIRGAGQAAFNTRPLAPSRRGSDPAA